MSIPDTFLTPKVKRVATIFLLIVFAAFFAPTFKTSAFTPAPAAPPVTATSTTLIAPDNTFTEIVPCLAANTRSDVTLSNTLWWFSLIYSISRSVAPCKS